MYRAAKFYRIAPGPPEGQARALRLIGQTLVSPKPVLHAAVSLFS
jgi:hypothetical protein